MIVRVISINCSHSHTQCETLDREYEHAIISDNLTKTRHSLYSDLLYTAPQIIIC